MDFIPKPLLALGKLMVNLQRKMGKIGKLIREKFSQKYLFETNIPRIFKDFTNNFQMDR